MRPARALHRRFARCVGASLAWVIRRGRLRAAAARLTACPPADWRAVAWAFGDADQAHFVRDVRFTTLPETAFHSRIKVLAYHGW